MDLYSNLKWTLKIFIVKCEVSELNCYFAWYWEHIGKYCLVQNYLECFVEPFPNQVILNWSNMLSPVVLQDCKYFIFCRYWPENEIHMTLFPCFGWLVQFKVSFKIFCILFDHHKLTKQYTAAQFLPT